MAIEKGAGIWLWKLKLAWHALVLASKDYEMAAPHEPEVKGFKFRIVEEAETNVLELIEEGTPEQLEFVNDLLWRADAAPREGEVVDADEG